MSRLRPHTATARAALAVLAALALAACGAPAATRPDLVLVVLDTLRADRLSCYGYPRPTSPHLDALAARAVRFTSASATSAWTVPSHASLFTGLYPIEHGATQEHPRLGPSLPTLAELLAARGYATLGVSANPLVGPTTGLERGFERFEIAWRAAKPGAPHPVVATAERWVSELPPERPFLLYVDFMETHHPYAPPPASAPGLRPRTPNDPLRARARSLSPEQWYLDPDAVGADVRAALGDVYDGSVAAADAAVGALLAALERTGRLDRALVIVTADHGEALGDHGHLRHLFQLHTALVRVPLLVVPPGGGPGEVRDEAVSGVDVFATLAMHAGVALPASHPGRDLLSPPPEDDARAVFAEYYYPVQALSNLGEGVLAEHPEAFARFRRRLRSVERDGVRLLASSRAPHRLYDLRSDPDERVDRAGDPALAAAETDLAARLEAFGRARPLDAAEPELPASVFGPLDPATEQRLRELGYVR